MHIHAQTKVDQMTIWLKKKRGHDQHAAITTTITTSITTSSPRLDLGVCGFGLEEETSVQTLEEQARSLGIGPSEWYELRQQPLDSIFAVLAMGAMPFSAGASSSSGAH